MQIRILLSLAVLPAILLAKSVLSYDRIEKEPTGLLIKMFAFGMLSCAPSALLEMLGETLIMRLVANTTLITVLIYLVLVPGVEEGMKYLALRRVHNNPNFNYTFDGIVYGVMVALGFATLENILYVLDSMSIELAVMRGMLSVPLHTTCGVYMGYYYGVARGQEARGEQAQAQRAYRLAMLVPCVIHGLYDYSLSLESAPVLVACLALTVVIFLSAARQVRIASANDRPIAPNFWNVPTFPLQQPGTKRPGQGTPPPPFNLR